jgi:hypothetical protein
MTHKVSQTAMKEPEVIMLPLELYKTKRTLETAVIFLFLLLLFSSSFFLTYFKVELRFFWEVQVFYSLCVSAVTFFLIVPLLSKQVIPALDSRTPIFASSFTMEVVVKGFNFIQLYEGCAFVFFNKFAFTHNKNVHVYKFYDTSCFSKSFHVNQ